MLLVDRQIDGRNGIADQFGQLSLTDRPEKPSSEFLLHFAVLLKHVGELDVRRTITVPGEVISSNAREVEGRTSIWAINASNMMSQSQDMTPEIVFSGAGLKIKPVKE